MAKVLRIALYTIIITIIVFICLLYSTLYNTKSNKDVNIIIPAGSSIKNIAEIITDNGIVKHYYQFLIPAKMYCAFYNRNLKAGEFSIKNGANILSIIQDLSDGRIVKRKITIIEGYTTSQILNKLTKEDSLMHSLLLEYHDIKEGELLPETYFYTYGTTDLDIIIRMKNKMRGFLRDEWAKRDTSIDKVIHNLEEVLILASIVEKETALKSEKPIIAGVYLNRLKKNMKLQADPTVIYGITNGQKIFKRRLRYKDLFKQSQYNTYINYGLTPTPICNPGKDSIIAVLHPAWTDNLFFVSNKKGSHLFSKDFNIHKINIAKVNS